MNEGAKRLALTSFAALAILLLLSNKGHGPSLSKGNAVAFVHRTAEHVVVKVAGVPEHSGVYLVPEPATVGSVMKLSVPARTMVPLGDEVAEQPVRDGETIRFAAEPPGLTCVLRESMSTRERIALEIPLDPSIMTVEDWDALPGVGPITAKNIVEYRQCIGGFSSLVQLEQVPGVGPATMARIKPYFSGNVIDRKY